MEILSYVIGFAGGINCACMLACVIDRKWGMASIFGVALTGSLLTAFFR